MSKKKDAKKSAKKHDKRKIELAEVKAQIKAKKNQGAKQDPDGKSKKGGLGKSRKRAAMPVEAEPNEGHDFSYTQGREVSWLRFDERVLDESFDETVPLFERMKFVAIFGSNLDEWFMVRIGSLSDLTHLKHQPHDIRCNETPGEQIEHALSMLPPLLEKQASAFSAIEANLAGAGITRVRTSDLTDVDLRRIAQHFKNQVAPIISPMIIDPRHPFPNLKNGELYAICSLKSEDEEGLLGIVEVPPTLPRVIELPSTPHNWRYVLLEDVILSRLSECFGNYEPTSKAVVRVTRNADVDPDEGSDVDEDYRQHMKAVLKRRQRLQPVRLEIDRSLSREVEDYISHALDLEPSHVFHTHMPLDLGYVYGLEDHIPEASRDRLLYEPCVPQDSPMTDVTRPMREQVEDHDILLFYPYEAMTPLLRLLREASSDQSCISIKITLYRVAKQSHLCESLINAAENGKEVTVLMELRARFDEANNIAWAERLENAGCTVIYGTEGFKCHSKICQITYQDKGKVKRITCLGTGNFNEKTAKTYSDFMLLTAHDGIGEDGNTFFRNLSLGNLFGTYQHLGVAPHGLKPLVMSGLDREIDRARAGEPAQVFMKMNSLTDRDVIDKIAEACQAGVTVVMIIRGITCIKANIPERTDGLVVRQIVGRFLEHARVYAFGVETDLVYLSSADMMTRNTEHRVEIAYPVLDDHCRSLVMQYVNLQLADNAKARQLTSEGTWRKVATEPGEPSINSQELLITVAKMRAGADESELAPMTPFSRIYPDLTLDQLRRVSSIPSQMAEPVEVQAAPKHAKEPATEVEAVPVAEPKEEPASQAVPEAKPESVIEAEPAVEEPAASEPEPEAEATEPTKPEPEVVEAHIIENEPDQDVLLDTEDEKDSVSKPQDEPAQTTLTKRKPGRFTVGFKLIMLGFKTLFTGHTNDSKDQ